MACPICGHGELATLHKLYDDRYGYPDAIRLAVCRECGHKFSDPPLRGEVLETLYTRYYQREATDPARFRAFKASGRLGGWLSGEFSSAAMWVPRNVRVLDIGCGLGANVAFHAARGCQAQGIDADANIRIVAERFGLNLRVGLFQSKDYEPESFDFVTMDQVVEHVGDPVETLTEVRKVLKPGGHLVMSTPNANGWGARLFGGRWLNWHVPYHQQFFSGNSMRLLARTTGFAIERMSTITRSAWLVYQIAHLLTYPAPGIPSIFWAPNKNKLRVDQVVMLKLVMATRLTLLPQLATRLFDSMGFGDNHLVVLRKTGPGERASGSARDE